jgi:hypothetical protein
VGAPRSGTTWLQNMLGSHPSVASPQETDLFRRYLEPLTDAWEWQHRGGPGAWADRRFKGLPAVLSTDEFTAIARDFTDAIVARAAALRPGATIVLEKSPSTSLCADVVTALMPDARVVHLVRDGRDVAASLLAASESWGRWWAPRTLPQAARAWLTHVRGARRASELGLPYFELRYEALSRGDAGVLSDLHRFCGIDLPEDAAASLYASFSFERMAGTADRAPDESRLLVGGDFGAEAAGRAEPEGFYRRGAVAGWRDEWTAKDRLVFDAVAGDLLVELGYEPDHRWAADAMRARVYRYQALASSAVGASTRWLGRRGDRLSQRTPRA